MIKRISDIIERNVMKVDILNGIRKIQCICQEEGIECFVAYEGNSLVGVITNKELIGAHPNRIVADIMSDKYICIDYDMFIWEVKEIFNLNKSISIILIENEGKIVGYVTKTILNIELGKHIDLLTGLFKSDYMFYNAYNLIRNDKDTTIIFLDLDNFGYIDKLYGHINGDIILKKVADLLSENIDSDSFLCRYAGDEFAIVTSKNTEDSKIFADRISNSIKSHLFPNEIQVSVSIGITCFKIKNKKVKNIFKLVDTLVNIASLSSSKAKQSINNSIIIEAVDLDAIA